MNPSIPYLIDFDGVIKIGDSPAPDAEYFLKYITEKKIPAIILSNSTLYSGNHIKEFLFQNKIDFGIQCITTVDASLKYIRENNLTVKPYCTAEIKNLFSNFTNEINPDAVLIGDLQDKWNYEILNDIFRHVINGAEIIAMQKNKFWMPGGNLCLDAGAFIAAIEYASGKEAKLIGKPSAVYFESALQILGFNKGTEFIMIGDDAENDIEAAQKINGKGILVFTGKTKHPLPENCRIKPDYEAFSLKEIITHL
jgi:HAD superfamily hydrolase (TIGR01458 family)